MYYQISHFREPGTLTNELGQTVTTPNGEPKQEPDSPLHDGDTPPPSGHKGDLDDCSPSPPVHHQQTNSIHHPHHLMGGGHLSGVFPDMKINAYNMMHGLSSATGPGIIPGNIPGASMAHMQPHHSMVHHNNIGTELSASGGVHMNNNNDVDSMLNEYHAL